MPRKGQDPCKTMDMPTTAMHRAGRSRTPPRWSPKQSHKRGFFESTLQKAIESVASQKARGSIVSESAGSSDDSGDKIEHFEWSPGQVLHRKYRLDSLSGDGTFGRVCLATDMHKKCQVAIKIIRNVERHTSSAQIEAHILSRISEADPWGRHRCCHMYEAFMHESGNFCMVLEPLGPNLYELIKANHFRGFWLQDIQIMSKQILYALSFLHNHLNLIHTDLKPENILVTSMDSGRVSWFPRKDFWEASQMQADERQKRRCFPPYMRPRHVGIKLIDFGNAASDEDDHNSLINTRQYRGPEVILETGWDTQSDIWSAGCIFMELYTGEMFFSTHESMEHLALMEQIIGPLPEHMTARASENVKSKLLKRTMSSPSGLRWSLNWPEGAWTNR